MQERREEGFVQKKYNEVGSANYGSWGRSVGGQWCEMGGDERVVALKLMSERAERWREEELRKLRE